MYKRQGVESLGENFFKGENLAFGPEFQTVWEPYAKAALSGGVWLRSGYATEPLRTGDSIVSVASSASVLSLIHISLMKGKDVVRIHIGSFYRYY